MAEHSLICYVMDGMRPYWRGAVKHADGFTAGIADLSAWIAPAGNIWIELKATQAWPSRGTTPVKFGLDDLQKQFLWNRRGWVLARVRREYLLFTHALAQELDTPAATRGHLTYWATRIWDRSINWKEFSECVGKRYE
jgi:hypothetical protein